MRLADTRNSSPSVTPIVEKYRAAIVNELRAFYRDERKLDNYAARLGELMTLLTVFDVRCKCKGKGVSTSLSSDFTS